MNQINDLNDVCKLIHGLRQVVGNMSTDQIKEELDYIANVIYELDEKLDSSSLFVEDELD